MINLKQSKKHESNTRSLVNMTRTALLAVVMLAILAACKKDKIEEDIVNPPTFTGRLIEQSFFGMHVNTFAIPSVVPFPAPANFGSVRFWGIGLEWHRLNPSEDVYDWEKMDISVKNVQDHGKEILFVLGGSSTPRWASTNPDGTGCAYGNGTCYAPEIDAWKKFITAITTRYDGNHGHGKIKYWEIWNEPNAKNFWGEVVDPYGKLVKLAEAAYPIIKAADPNNVVVSPAPQGSNSHKWLDEYFAAGGDKYTDAIAFHSYFFGGEPEKIITLTENVKQVQEKYPALAGKPLWDTEHCWGDDFHESPSTPFAVNEDEQCAWVARHKILSASIGIESSYWYMWNGWKGQIHYGWLYNENDDIFRKPGIAYNEVYDWLVGAEIGTGALSAGLYQCPIKRPDGYKGLIVWAASSNPSYTRSFKVPGGYTKYRTLDGGTENTSAGESLTLTMKPILLENQ